MKNQLKKTHTDRVVNNLREILHGLGGLGGFNAVIFSLGTAQLIQCILHYVVS